MISALSRNVVRFLIGAELVEAKDRELYEYGMFIILSNVSFFLISGLWGWILGNSWESMLFYILFSTLRCYAGGYHAKSETRCTCYTIVALFIASCAIKLLYQLDSIGIVLVLLFVFDIIICLLSPSDSGNKQLNRKEEIYYKKKTIVIVLAITIFVLCGVIIGANGIKNSLITCLALESFLLILDYLKRWTSYLKRYLRNWKS